MADQLAHLIISDVMVNSAHFSPEYSVKAVQCAISVYGLVCTDGNYGIYHAALAHMHLYLSEHLWLADQIDEAFAALDIALMHAQKYERICSQADAMYTAPLLRLSRIECKSSDSTEIAACLSEDWPWWCVPDCSKVKSKMQTDPRWAEWVKRTKEYLPGQP